jgi:hypothetical protein
MRRKTLLLLLIITSSLAFSQTLEENKVDEFTNASVKRTSWETLNMTRKFDAYFRISKIDSIVLFDLKMILGNVFSIDEGQEIMFKLTNDEIVKLPNLEYEITCSGCGAIGYAGSRAQGIYVKYPMKSEQIEKLMNDRVEKIRVYTNVGYVEDEFRNEDYLKFQKALTLVK